MYKFDTFKENRLIEKYSKDKRKRSLKASSELVFFNTYSYKILTVLNHDKIKVKIIFGETTTYAEKCH